MRLETTSFIVEGDDQMVHLPELHWILQSNCRGVSDGAVSLASFRELPVSALLDQLGSTH